MPPAAITDVREIIHLARKKGSQQTGVGAKLAALRGPWRPLPPGWEDDPEWAEAHRVLAREALEEVPDYPAGQFQGRGVVVVGGGPYWAAAWVSVRLLRSAGCELPVELWYFGHAGELDDSQQALFAAQGCTCRDLSHANHLRPYRHALTGWEGKPLAVLESSFEEVLYLDADCYVARDPTDLFDGQGYRERGAVFFPDGRAERLTPLAWEVFGLAPRDEPAFESGQFLVDKRRWWRTLRLVWHLNSHSDFYYRWRGHTDPGRVLYGDKDTFHMAAWLTNQPYVLWGEEPLVQDDAYLHRDGLGEVRFVHRCRNKFHLGASFGTTPQPAPRTRVTPGLPREAEAWLALLEAESHGQVRDAWRPAHPTVVCVPTLCRHDMLARLVRALELGSLTPDLLLVLDNGDGCPELRSDRFPIEVHRPGRNLGCGASWNWFLDRARREGWPAVVVANDDVVPAFRTLELLHRKLAEDQGALVVTAEDPSGMWRWSLFAQRACSVDLVGPYDEEFWPAYFEDNDYKRRLLLCGSPAVTAPGATFAHLESATTQALRTQQPDVWALHNHFHLHNRQRYLAKWGGPPEQETFAAPFGRTSWRHVPGAFDFQDVYLQAIHEAPVGGALVEVGCYQGRSLLFLAEAAATTGKRLRVWGVEHGLGSPSDSAHDRGLIAQHGSLAALLAANVARAGLTGHVGLLVMPSVAGARMFGNVSLDLVYVDAAHDRDNVQADLEAWWPKVKVGGTLAGHDYHHPGCPDVRPTVDAFFAARTDHGGVRTLGGSFLVTKKLAPLPTGDLGRLTFFVVRRDAAPWTLRTERALAAYCRRFGHQVLYGDPADPGLNPSWGKTRAFDLVGADHVVLLDYDVLPLPWAPDLAEHLDRSRPAAVLDPALASPGSIVPALDASVAPEQQRLNCGFLAWPRSLRHVLDEVYGLRQQYHSVWHEQPAVNEAAVRHALDVQLLDPRWNTLLPWELGRGRDLREVLHASWFVHLAGDADRDGTLDRIDQELGGGRAC